MAKILTAEEVDDLLKGYIRGNRCKTAPKHYVLTNIFTENIQSVIAMLTGRECIVTVSDEAKFDMNKMESIYAKFQYIPHKYEGTLLVKMTKPHINVVTDLMLGGNGSFLNELTESTKEAWLETLNQMITSINLTLSEKLNDSISTDGYPSVVDKAPFGSYTYFTYRCAIGDDIVVYMKIYLSTNLSVMLKSRGHDLAKEESNEKITRTQQIELLRARINVMESEIKVMELEREAFGDQIR